MKIALEQDDEALAALGAEAAALLCRGEIEVLAKRFGYALAFDRDPAAAIREDLASCLAELHARQLLESVALPPTVKRFKPTDTGVVAVVETSVSTEKGSNVLIELVVTEKGSDRYLTLEQVSAGA